MAGQSVCRSLGLGGVCGFGTCIVVDNSGVLGRIIVHNGHDKRVARTSESPAFHFPATIILNYTTTTLGNNNN